MTTGTNGNFTADFDLVKRGYDPQQVMAHLEHLRTTWLVRIDQAEKDRFLLESQVEDAKTREEAIHLTLIAATKTKDEMLTAAKRQLDEARASANDEAERIISDAKYEAFRIVTEAHDEAEAALTEARSEAERVRTATHDEGASRNGAGHAPGERVVGVSKGLLTRLDRLDGVTDDLEARLRDLATTALDELASVRTAVRVERDALDDLEGLIPSVSSVADDHEPDPGRPTAEEVIEKIAERVTGQVAEPVHKSAPEPIAERSEVETAADGTTEADIPPPLTEPIAAGHDRDNDSPATERGSFYSRRSAGLPRIGADANNALATINAMRSAMKDEEENVAAHSA